MFEKGFWVLGYLHVVPVCFQIGMILLIIPALIHYWSSVLFLTEIYNHYLTCHHSVSMAAVLSLPHLWGDIWWDGWPKDMGLTKMNKIPGEKIRHFYSNKQYKVTLCNFSGTL